MEGWYATVALVPRMAQNGGEGWLRSNVDRSSGGHSAIELHPHGFRRICTYDALRRLVYSELHFYSAMNPKVVPQLGNAPSLSVWKTDLHL